MKIKNVYLPVIVLILFANMASAMPIGSSGQDRDYLISEQPLQKWCLGVFSESRKRDASYNRGWESEMKTSKIMGYVGYDAVSWINTYVTAGSQEDEIIGRSSSGSTYGFGAVLNLLDHEMMDPALMEDRIRLSATIQYTFGSWENTFGQTEKMNELYGSLIMSLVNDIEGNKAFWPNAVSIFAGPVYSDIQCDVLSVSDKIGITVGMEIFLTDYITLGIGAEKFSSNGGWAALSIRF